VPGKLPPEEDGILEEDGAELDEEAEEALPRQVVPVGILWRFSRKVWGRAGGIGVEPGQPLVDPGPQRPAEGVRWLDLSPGKVVLPIPSGLKPAIVRMKTRGRWAR